jgi:hypothetical protein
VLFRTYREGISTLAAECDFELTRRLLSPASLEMCGHVTHSVRVVMSRSIDANIWQVAETCVATASISLALLVLLFLPSISRRALVAKRAPPRGDASVLEYAANRLWLAAMATVLFILLPIVFCLYTREEMSNVALDVIWLLIFLGVIVAKAALIFRSDKRLRHT